MRIDYNHLTTLATVDRLGSFEAAAAELGITPSAISQRIRALEDRVGTSLLVRSQPVTATTTGRRLVRHAREVDLLEAALISDIGLDSANRTDAQPVVRVAVNADSLATWLIPALAEVREFMVDVVVDDQDHSADWLRRGDVAAAITGIPGPVAGCAAHRLGALRYLATASEEFVDKWFKNGVDAAVLAQAPALTFNRKDRLQADWAAAVTGNRISPRTHFLPSSQALMEAARRGMGWCLIPEPLVEEHVASGNLVVVLADKPLDTPLFWQTARVTAGALSNLTRAVRQAAKDNLIPTAAGAEEQFI
ncbi:MAG: LysR family transcriptional regulator ArgP [Pseudomonadota bacterium]